MIRNPRGPKAQKADLIIRSGMSPGAIAREIDRRVSAEEIRAAVETEITAAERESFNELVTWFTTPYPTPEARLAYVQQRIGDGSPAPASATDAARRIVT